MQLRQDKEHITNLIEAAENIAVISGRNGTDGVGAAISIAEYITDKFGKSSVIVYPFDHSEFNQELLMLRPVANDLESKVLKMILDYSGTSIETVNYKKEEDARLILEVKPIDRNFDMSRIKYEFEGKSYDLIITMGIKNLEALGDFYTKNKVEFDQAAIINIDNSAANENFGKLNIVNPASVSLSALMLTKFAEWEYTPGNAAAKGLLIGING